MKQTCTLLLIIMAFVCVKQGYGLFSKDLPIKNHLNGNLSDIAEEVVAIPLETANGIRIEKARYIRQEGKNLFLISDDILYHFNRNGQFICRITRPEDIIVAGYVVNPAQQQLIVLGNTNDIFYYSYGGKLLDKKKLKSDFPHRRMLSASMYKGHIWSIEEKASPDETLSDRSYIEREVVKYDTSFQKIESQKLIHADLGRRQYAPACFAPQLSVSEETDTLYAYEASPLPDHLIRDSLYLKEKKEAGNDLFPEKEIGLFPIRFGKRMWISCYQNNNRSEQNYTFCYDTLKHESWLVKGGLTDNFYQTGCITQLEAMDLSGNNYCFYKSSTLFIVKLKA